jgi:hypothetical protein
MSALTKISVALCFTLAAIVAGCSTDRPKIQATLNERASLTGNLPANPLAWQVVTSTIDKSKSEMSTLYGNDVAVAYARSHADHNYPAGSVLALVCWTQTDDPRYFGARIPGKSKSVEFVTVSADSDGHPTYLDQFYDGTPLQKASEERSSAPTERAARILSLRSAVFP